MFNIFGKDIQTAREATKEEIKAVIDRYTKGEACGKAEDGTMFLQQQTNSAKIVQSSLTGAAIKAACEERKIKWNDAYEGRVKTYVASDASVDSYGDIINQKGWNLNDRFKKNPAIMWVHDYSQPNLGSGLMSKVDGENLLIDVLFVTAEMYPFADTIFKMVDGGILKGGSVGFIPTKVIHVEDEKEREELGLGKYGVFFDKQILLEFSICPLGANKNALVQNALTEGVKKGLISKEELCRATKDGEGQSNTPDSMKQVIDKALAVINDKSFFLPPVPKVTETPVVIVDPKTPAEEEVKAIEETENEVLVLVKKPDLSRDDTCKIVAIKKTNPRINSAMVKLKANEGKDADPMTLQAFRFPKEDGWNLDKVKAWLKDHPDMMKAMESVNERDFFSIALMVSVSLEIEGIRQFISDEVKALIPLMQGGKEAGSGGSDEETISPETKKLYDDLFEVGKQIQTLVAK